MHCYGKLFKYVLLSLFLLPGQAYTNVQLTYKGCYAVDNALPWKADDDYMDTDVCATKCDYKTVSVLGLRNGGQCYCGNTLPAQLVDDSYCNVPCYGYGTVKCGGASYWSVYLTGYGTYTSESSSSSSTSSSQAPSSSSSTTSSSTTSSSTSTSSSSTQSSSSKTTSSSSTMPSSSSSSSTESSSRTSHSSSKASSSTSTTSSGTPTSFITSTTTGPSSSVSASQSTVVGAGSKGSSSVGTGAIIGIVIGIVTFILVIILGFFVMRWRKRVVSVTVNPKDSSYSEGSEFDSRLEPSLLKRISTGSLADSQDYSRKILKVVN
ncbi:transmembrane receptor Wsc1 [Schizosaccharomyces japonicus yFS275]|uniref:Transmembrane receptor Wsc1 n=1 Tax=Schizosaccharomyces japonicus (strain yFS275 / FY16936) TaxID=402676 RepID=B6K1Z5_SCHJY|nr:transmembrane receptor Wsc1 [Schizosaccharomyces japonicus yFS275]EEB07176.1 transmembrane receptor Wsc1 [Schizosaccharomyces japonicus yFS275]